MFALYINTEQRTPRHYSLSIQLGLTAVGCTFTGNTAISEDIN